MCWYVKLWNRGKMYFATWMYSISLFLLLLFVPYFLSSCSSLFLTAFILLYRSLFHISVGPFPPRAPFYLSGKVTDTHWEDGVTAAHWALKSCCLGGDRLLNAAFDGTQLKLQQHMEKRHRESCTATSHAPAFVQLMNRDVLVEVEGYIHLLVKHILGFRKSSLVVFSRCSWVNFEPST